MKYLVLHGDGMGDYAVKELGGRTPLQAARTPAMNFLAERGTLGMVRTIPPGFPPGSDVGSLSLMGYDPRKYYTGRSPLEAAALGVFLSPGETSFRTNLVFLSGKKPAPVLSGERFDDLIMGDFSAGHIPSEEGKDIILTVNQKLGEPRIRFFPGTSYRNLLVVQGPFPGLATVPPHDITGKRIGDYLPRGNGSELLVPMMEKSLKILAEHPVNVKRRSQGQTPANCIWIWGQGTAPELPGFREKFGLSGGVISAVDLVRGIARLVGLKTVLVPGATGYLDTNYRGKLEAALGILTEDDFAYIHVEAPDEAAHTGKLELKIQAIEDFDREIVKKALDALEGWQGIPRLPGGEPVKILLVIDHRTPLVLKTHSEEPVPFAMLPGGKSSGSGLPYDESAAERSGIFIEDGSTLMNFFLN
jgi:2,3-bisphosphoglycerate-independent phosphoglycerate mutase